jgi:hypothetical protein
VSEIQIISISRTAWSLYKYLKALVGVLMFAVIWARGILSKVNKTQTRE